MTSRAGITFAPALMPARDAAAYLGVSETTLRNLPIPRRVLGAKRLFDRRDLDAFINDLPYEGQGDANSCDGLFR